MLLLKWVFIGHASNLSRSMSKPSKWSVHPAKTSISLGICPVWSESSLCALWVAMDPWSSCGEQRLWSDYRTDAQADLSLRCLHRSFCWFCHAQAHVLGFALPQLNETKICWLDESGWKRRKFGNIKFELLLNSVWFDLLLVKIFFLFFFIW